MLAKFKRGRVTGPDGLSQEFFVDGDLVLTVRLTEIVAGAWEWI